MQSPMSTRSSALGKRSRQQEQPSCDQLQTPDPTPNPKRVRTSLTVLDGTHNKENIPPFDVGAINVNSSPVSARATRALRRTSTETTITPPRVRTPSIRRASTSSNLSPKTPIAGISLLSLATPPPTPPTISPVNVRARALLRSTSDSDQDMPGRDDERATIRKFVASFFDSSSADTHKCSTLYISGSPGTGKTALVNSILRELGSEARDVNILTINCMALNNVDSLWERLVEEFDDGKKTRKAASKAKKNSARDTVERLLTSLDTKCILVLDELDHITPTSQSLTSLFSLPTSNPSSIRVIGIANTHTLTSSSSSSFVPSSHVDTVHFAPYTPAQLLQILQARLAPLYESDEDASAKELTKRFLSQPALTLLSKKVAALTGDVRSLFEVLRGAIDIAVSSSSSAGSASSSSIPTVNPPHILAALKAYSPSSALSGKASPSSLSTTASPVKSSSEIVCKVRALGLQARLVLLSVLLASKRLEAGVYLSSPSAASSPVKRSQSSPNFGTTGKSTGIESSQLHTFYTTILGRVESGVFSPVSRSEFGDLIGMLEGIGLVSVSSSIGSSSPVKGGKRAFGRSASFGSGANKGGSTGEVKLGGGVWADEVLRGLGAGSTDPEPSGDIREEEVRDIWIRENSRLARDLKAVELKAASKGALGAPKFGDAMED